MARCISVEYNILLRRNYIICNALINVLRCVVECKANKNENFLLTLLSNKLRQQSIEVEKWSYTQTCRGYLSRSVFLSEFLSRWKFRNEIMHLHDKCFWARLLNFVKIIVTILCEYRHLRLLRIDCEFFIFPKEKFCVILQEALKPESRFILSERSHRIVIIMRHIKRKYTFLLIVNSKCHNSTELWYILISCKKMISVIIETYVDVISTAW